MATAGDRKQKTVASNAPFRSYAINDETFTEVTFGSLHRVITDTGRQLALKSMTPPWMQFSDADCGAERLRNQLTLDYLRLLSSLKHENVLQFVHAEFRPPTCYQIFMEFVEGRTLEDELQQSRRRGLERGRTSGFCRMICSALHFLHTQQPPIVHSCVNPRNVMIDKSSGAAKLINFGISRRLDRGHNYRHLFSTSELLDAYFLPPEMSRTQSEHSTQADIWSLGCTVYQMCDPQRLDTKRRILFRIATRTLHRTAPELPRHWHSDLQLAEFYSACVQPLPHSRPTAAQLLQLPFVADSRP